MVGSKHPYTSRIHYRAYSVCRHLLSSIFTFFVRLRLSDCRNSRILLLNTINRIKSRTSITIPERIVLEAACFEDNLNVYSYNQTVCDIQEYIIGNSYFPSSTKFCQISSVTNGINGCNIFK